MKKIAIVGASGFVGSTLVERLLEQVTDEVLPFIHSSGNAMRLARRGIELRPLDLLDSAQVEAALTGVTHIVNCSRGGSDVMLNGLKNLLTASKEHRVERFVHLSSVAVYGDPPPPQSAHENSPPIPAKGSYGWLKLQQDEMVMRAVDAGVPSLILCPPNISGPYSYFLVALVDALRANTFALLEDGTAPCNLIDVSNLSYAIELALSNGEADGARMFVTDDADIDWRTVVDSVNALSQSEQRVPALSREELLATAGNTSESKISVMRSFKHLVSSDVRQAIRKDPLWEKIDSAVRMGVARLGKTVESNVRLSVEGPTRVTKVDSGPRIESGLCRQQLRGVRHSCELAKTRLAYKPIYTVAESMEAFRKWYRTNHGMDTDLWPLLRQLY